jgi:hypothetical protein
MLQSCEATAFRLVALILPFLMITYVQYELIIRLFRVVAKNVYFLCPVHPLVRLSIHMYLHGSYWTDFSEIWYLGGGNFMKDCRVLPN